MKMKIKPNKIAFDMDDVVADFITLFLKVLKNDVGIDMAIENITNFSVSNCIDLSKRQINKVVSKTVNNPIELDMQMKLGAKEVILKLLKRGPVYFVTARKDGKIIKAWIESKLGTSPNIIIVAMNSHNSKAKALLKRGIEYFVDDRLETCYQIHEAGITPILFTQPHNSESNPFKRVGSWKKIDSMIDWS